MAKDNGKLSLIILLFSEVSFNLNVVQSIISLFNSTLIQAHEQYITVDFNRTEFRRKSGLHDRLEVTIQSDKQSVYIARDPRDREKGKGHKRT